MGPHIYDGQDWVFLPGFSRSDDDTRNYTAYQDADGSIWVIGDRKSGVWLYDNGKWIEGLNSESKPLEGGRVAPLRAPDGTLWMSAVEGIYYLNAERKWEKSIDLNDSINSAIWDVGGRGGGFSPQLHLTANGTLIAVNGQEGLLVYDGKQWSTHRRFGPGRQYNDH